MKLDDKQKKWMIPNLLQLSQQRSQQQKELLQTDL